MAPIYVVTEEEVIGLGTPAADLEELDEVVELAVDVPTNLMVYFLGRINECMIVRC